MTAAVIGLVTCAMISMAVAHTTLQPPAAPMAIADTWQARALQTLAAMPDASAQIMVGMLERSASGGSNFATSDAFDRAVTMDPHAADIAMLDVVMCSQVKGCDVSSREAYLRRIDADNSAVWMATLHAATVHHNASGMDETLLRMGQATRFDLYFKPLAHRFAAALSHVAVPENLHGTPTEWRQVEATSMFAALIMPPVQDILRACNPGTLAGDRRRASCRRIAISMERGDTLVANMVGLRIHQWTAHDAAERTQVLAQHRRLQWRMARMQSLPQAMQIAAIFSLGREGDGIDAVLAAARQPLDPPTGWSAREPTRKR